jgi:endonuclease/exonuclease/phosphatase family protein
VTDYYVAFWNLENLFDVEGSPRRTDKLERTLKGELTGWTQPVLDRKVSQLGRIISQMNGSRGPDLLGVCEIENDYVLGLLTTALQPLGRQYQVVHSDSQDDRGIDVAFIYDAALLEAHEKFFHVIVKRVATRELVQVNFLVKPSNNVLVAIGNHWPSRLGGAYESEPYRIVAGETLGYFHERIRQVLGQQVAVIAMGDFNDEPFNRALVDHALSESSRVRVTRATSPKFWNLMWSTLGQGVATLYNENEGYLFDQFMVSKGLATGGAGIKVLPESVEVLRFSGMVKPGDYPAPIRFGRGSELNQNGFSDHFPIGVKVRV